MHSPLQYVFAAFPIKIWGPLLYPLESGLTLGHALANRMQQKSHCGSSEPSCHFDSFLAVRVTKHPDSPRPQEFLGIWDFHC